MPRKKYVVEKVFPSGNVFKGRLFPLNKRGYETMFRVSLAEPVKKGDVVEILRWETNTARNPIFLHKTWQKYATRLKKVNR